MPIDCNLWPMNILTKPVGEKDRKLIIHPKEAILRKGIRRNQKGELSIIDPKAVKIPDGTYCLERKEQGHRHFLVRGEDNDVAAVYGRRLNVDKTYTNIYPKLKASPLAKIWYQLPKNTVLDFELCWPGHPDSEVTTAIKECPEELHPYFFSAPIVEGENMMGKNSDAWFEGRKQLRKWVGKEYMTKGYKPIYLEGENKAKVLTHLLRYADKMDWEGFVLKELFCDGWWKLKGTNEADVFIIGFKISKAETRMGLATAVKIAVYKKGEVFPMGNVSGFKVEVMEDMTAHPAKYMNRALRVVYQEIAGKGKMKHGFFDGWRDDKSPSECSYAQFE